MTDEVAIVDYDPRWPQRFALEESEYAELKRSLANAYGDDRHAYMSAKSEFINRITAIAMSEGQSTR